MAEEKIMSIYFSQCAEQGIMANFDQEEQAGICRLLEKWSIKKDDKVLEAGCGSGRLTRLLAEKINSQGEILAMDLAPGMIEKANMHCLPNYVQFEVGSVNSVARPDRWFDKIICFNVFPHFADIPAVLSEFSRILKSGGELWINHLKSREVINAFHRSLNSVVNKHMLPEDEYFEKYLQQYSFKIVVFENNDENGYCLKIIKY